MERDDRWKTCLDVATTRARVALPPAARVGRPASAIAVIKTQTALARVGAAERVGDAVSALALDFAFAALPAVVVAQRAAGAAAGFVAVVVAVVARATGGR